MPQTHLTPGSVIFGMPDADPAITGVRLWQDLGLPERSTIFRSDRRGGWTLRVPFSKLEGLTRLEYQYLVDFPSDSCGVDTQWWRDPTNPESVGGPFGEKSSLELPGYLAPSWLAEVPTEPGHVSGVAVETEVGLIEGELWSPVDDDSIELGLLLVHDGPEMVTYARLLDYAKVMMSSGRLPAFRLGLLSPGARDERYAANDGYARALAGPVLDAFTSTAATFPRVVLAGASLGGLAALHAEWTVPGTFAGVFSQSGSFFTPHTDAMESGYRHFDQITEFVAQVHQAASSPTDAVVALTCGIREENMLCNRLMAGELQRLGIGKPLVEHPDLHNWICWRDTFHPHLTRLLAELWSPSLGKGA